MTPCDSDECCEAGVSEWALLSADVPVVCVASDEDADDDACEERLWWLRALLGSLSALAARASMARSRSNC